MKVHHTVLYGLLQQARHGFAEISVKFLQRIQGFFTSNWGVWKQITSNECSVRSSGEQ